MAHEDFSESLAPVERPRGSFFSSGNFMNFMRGLDKGGDGVHQTWIEIQEALGIVPEGSADFFTQEAKKRQAAIKEKLSPEADLRGADPLVLTGEVAAGVFVPIGKGKVAKTLLGGFAGTTIFNEESNPRATAAQVGIGALIGRLLARGPAQDDLKKGIDSAQLRLTGPSPKTPRLTDQRPNSTGGLSTEFQAAARPPQKLLPRPPRPAQESGQVTGLPPQIAEELAARTTSRGVEGGLRASREGTEAAFTGVSRPSNVMTKATQALQERTLKRVTAELTRVDSAIAKAEKAASRKGAKVSTVAKAEKDLEALRARQTAARAMLKELSDRGTTGSNALTKVRAAAAENVAPVAAKTAAKVVTKAGKRKPITKAEIIKLIRAEAPQILKGINPEKMSLKQLQTLLGKAAKKGGVQATRDLVKLAKGTGSVTDKQLRGAIKEMTGKAPSPKSNTEQLARVFNSAVDEKTAGMTKVQKAAFFATLGIGGATAASASDDGPGEGAGAGLLLAGAMLGIFGGPTLIRALSKATKASPTAVDDALKAGMKQASKEGGQFNAGVQKVRTMKDFIPEVITDLLTSAGNVLDKYLGSIETRLMLLSPKIANALSKMEYQVHSVSGKWLLKSEQAFRALDNAKMTGAQTQKFNILLNNSRGNAIRYLDSLGHTAAASEFRILAGTLDDIGEYLGSVGLGKGLRKEYFPRQVDDLTMFDNVKEVKTYLEHLAKVKKINLTDYEKQNVLTDLMNDAVSRSSDQNFGRAAKSLKRRFRKVDSRTLKAYAEPRQAFNNYAEDIARQVERRKFFKGQKVNVDNLGAQGENIASVSSLLARGLGKDITSKQADEVAELIRARFGPGEQASGRGVQNFKNFSYAGLLGNPIAAITQLGDLALSAHRNGIRNTVSAILEQIGRKGKLDKHRDLGLRDATVDFASKVASRDVLEWALKYSGFKTMDRFGKNVFINAAMKRNREMSKGAFFKKWSQRYDPEGGTKRTEKLYNDVQQFQKTGITDANREDIGLMAWNELAQVQPIGLSSLPQAYLENPNGRMAYMLQTFTLKLFDVMRKDIVQQAAAGNKLLAAKNAGKLVSMFVLLNAGTDAAKNFLTGKSATPGELLINNFIKMTGANRFTFDTAGRQGLGSAVSSIVMPPTAMIDALIDPKKAVGLIPIIGRNAQQFIE